ncbi:MAG: PIN domain-containing protein [Pseudomonadota bacterium]
MYVLDTNIVRDIVRNPAGKAAQKFYDEAEYCFLSVVVRCEIENGFAKDNMFRGFDELQSLLQTVETLPLEISAAAPYGKIRSELESTGKKIGPNDLFIAAHCSALDAVLVTDNEREFSRVAGLKVENWMR